MVLETVSLMDVTETFIKTTNQQITVLKTYVLSQFLKLIIMKTIKLFLIMAVVAIAFASCSESVNGVDETIISDVDEKSAEVATICGTCDFSGTLTEAEIAGLMEMREEEKLARQFYIFMYEKYEYRVFNNISKSENAHTSAVLYLIGGFGLTDPTPAVDTEFCNPIFTELYTQLTEKGSESLIQALKVGAYIEELDINDLQNLIETTENPAVKKVYGNLLRASKIHLKAFTNSLKLLNETYTPTVISVEKYNEILGI